MKIFVTIVLASLWVVSVQAQPDGERLETFKISFLTRNLDLTPEEAQRFWPVYNEYQDKVKALRDERRDKFYEEWKNRDNLDEADYEQSLNKYIDFRQREVDLDKKYVERFQQVLPASKVARLIVLEERFKLMVLNELRKRRDENRPMRR